MKIRLLNLAMAIAAAGLLAVTQNASSASTNNASQPDNTERNKRDRNDQTLTPGDQGANESDRQITRATRRAITSKDELSTAAKNVKIITVNGKVTLRGPVNTEQEKQTIAASATQAGAASVDNQLEVKTNNQ